MKVLKLLLAIIAVNLVSWGTAEERVKASVVAEYDKVDFPTDNIIDWIPLGTFTSHFGCARACMKAEPLMECQIFDYDGVNQECKAGNLGDYDHELLGSSMDTKRVWIDKSKFCTGEPDPVPNGKRVCHMKSKSQRCMLVCDTGYTSGQMILDCILGPDNQRYWNNLLPGHKCYETVVVIMGGNPNRNHVHMLSKSESKQLSNFFETDPTYLHRGTVQFNVGQLLFYSPKEDDTLSIEYNFSGPNPGSKVNFTSQTTGVLSSVKMDSIYILDEKSTGVVVEQIELTGSPLKITHVAKEVLTIVNKDGFRGHLGCAARFSDTSLIYIAGTKAVEVNIVSREYKFLPGELNIHRDAPGCDVIMIDGMMTVLVAGGNGIEAGHTSEYYDKNLLEWKLTSGNLTDASEFNLRESAALVTTSEGTFALGGHIRNVGSEKSVEMFDTVTQQWVMTSLVTAGMHGYGLAATAVPKEFIP